MFLHQMCVISDHRNDLQYGPVLRHQEQQGGYIDGELTPLPSPPAELHRPDQYKFTEPFVINLSA